MIKIFPGQMPSEPIAQQQFAGPLVDLFEAAGIDYAAQAVQPITLHINGCLVPAEAWGSTVVAESDLVEIRPVPHGGLFKPIGKLLNFFLGWLVPSVSNQRYDTPQGQQLNAAEGKANVARLNAVVPELLGHFLRRPDYLVPPRRYFSSPREQWLEMLLCVGPGQYQIDPATVKIGNTPLVGLDGAEFTIHQPGVNLSGLSMAENWYACPEVGGTSAGTAGLDLVVTDSGSVNPDNATSFVLDGDQIIADATYPTFWGVGTVMTLLFEQPVTVAVVTSGEDSWNTFAADWREIAPAPGVMLTASGALTGPLRVDTVSGNVLTLAAPEDDGGSIVYKRISGMPAGPISLAVCRTGRTYTITALSDNTISVAPVGGGAWAGFAPRTVAASNAKWEVDPDTIYGEQAGPFVACPAAEVTTTIDVDVFFQQGLCRVSDDGRLEDRTVGIEIQWRDFATGGAWQSVTRQYTDATQDQIGFTERIALASAMRPQVRVRRRGARSTSTQVHDVVQWYALRSRLPTRASYPDWTTLSVRMRGLGQIAASSENQINLEATRMLPVLQPDGSWSSSLQPTRDISAAVGHICRTAGYTMDDIDLAELQRLHGIWTDRVETLDAIFEETTVQGALQSVLAAGMSELTLDDGRIRPVRPGLRTQPDQVYSAQNTTGDGITRSFTAPRPDDNDGVEVEYQDASDGWAAKTVQCMLPGSLGLRLEKIKLDGVTDRTRAWRIGMRRARAQRYRRWTYGFDTELDALNSNYGDFVALVDDIPGYGQSSMLESIAAAGAQAQLRVSEPLRWGDGSTLHVVAYRRPDGTLAGPWPATAGASEYEMLAAIPVGERPALTPRQEPPHVYFGPVARWTFPAIVQRIAPDGADSAKVQCSNYDAREYADDDSSPPAE